MSPEKKLFCAVAINDQGDYEQVQSLVKSNVNVNTRDARDNTPLMFASCRGSDSIIQLLLHLKANVNLVNEDGMTALFYAAGRHSPSIVNLLIEARADANHRDHRGETAMAFAELKKDNNRNRSATIQSLLAAKAMVSQKKLY